MGFLTSLSNTVQTGWASIIGPVASGTETIATSVLANPIPVAVALGAAIAVSAIANPQNRISRTIQKGIDACRSQWNKTMNSAKPLNRQPEAPLVERAAQHNPGPLGPGQASYLTGCGQKLATPYRSGESPSLQEGVLQTTHENNIAPMAQPFEEKKAFDPISWQLLQDWADQKRGFNNAHHIDFHNALRSLPRELQTQENFNALVEFPLPRSAKFLAYALNLLPANLQTQESFNALIRDNENSVPVANAIGSLTPELQNQEMLAVLIKAGYWAKEAAQAIMILPENLRNPELFCVLIEARYSAEKVAQAIMILPKNLQNDETLRRLLNMKYNPVETALILIGGEGVNEVDPLETDPEILAANHCHLSNCVGRRPALDGIGHIYEFQVGDYDVDTFNEKQRALMPAPEGPFGGELILPYRLFSKAMQQFACSILQEDPAPNQSVFEICERAKMRLVEQSQRFDDPQLNNTAEAFAVKNLLSTFEDFYCKLKLSRLGYSYTQENGRWTVPDAEALRHSLQGTQFEIGEVKGIVPGEEFLDKLLNCDVVIGDHAHDQWFHAYTQLSKFYTDPGRYIQEREEARSLVRSALDGLNRHPKDGAENILLSRIFHTVLEMYLDFTTASRSFGTHQHIGFQEVYMRQEYDSMLARLYPDHLNALDFKRAFWSDQFLPFAKNLVETYVNDEKMKKSLLEKLSQQYFINFF